MRAPKCILSLFLFPAVAFSFFGQAQERESKDRDPQSLEILKLVVQAAGGAAPLASVHDISEKGEATFHWGKGVKAQISILMLGANHYRMDADLPDGKCLWIASNGWGSKKQNGKSTPISRENALNLGNLTYPIGHVVAALNDSTTGVSFVGIEKRENRSVYRLRLKGQLGLISEASNEVVVKDVIVDAMTFDIVSIEDIPFAKPTVKNRHFLANASEVSGPLPRAVEFSQFHTVMGVRLPFVIVTKLLEQQTLTIHLTGATLNNNLTDHDFQP
jgi:hypothetical protein